MARKNDVPASTDSGRARGAKADRQGALSAVPVLGDIDVVEHEALRALRARDRRFPLSVSLDRCGELYPVVRAIVHRCKLELELNRVLCGLLRDGLQRHKNDIVHVHVVVLFRAP